MDSLEIEGKEYISARRAGREHGYTADYIGQLIRKGSLEGKKVGRAWYVSQESLSAYKEILESEKVETKKEMQTEVAPVVHEKVEVRAIDSGPLLNPYRNLQVSTEGKQETRPRVSAEEVDTVFGMRYLSDEDSVLPKLVVHKNELTEEVRVPVRTTKEDSVSEKKLTREGEDPDFVENSAREARGGHFKGTLQTLAIAGVLLITITVTGATVFLTRTITLKGDAVVAGVIFSWVK